MTWNEKKLKEMLKEKAGEIKPWTGQEWVQFYKHSITNSRSSVTLEQLFDVAILTAYNRGKNERNKVSSLG